MTEKAVAMPPTPTTSADYEAGIDLCLEAMRRLREQIDSDDVEIERLRAQTKAKLQQLSEA